jgi:hypothetical protein
MINTDGTSTLWSFGDSWGVGWNLPEHHQNYSEILSEKLNMPLCNFSDPGVSLGEIAHKFVRKSDGISSDDLVLVTVPPDSRWYKASEHPVEVLKPIYSTDHDYQKFVELIHANTYWFTWHHSLFLSMIYYHAQRLGCHLVMQHNYGSLDLVPELEFVKESFADQNHSMTYWLIGSDVYQLEITDDGSEHCAPAFQNFSESEYFLHEDNHPNQLGHQVIADKLYNLITQR